jgi:cytochrome b561
VLVLGVTVPPYSVCEASKFAMASFPKAAYSVTATYYHWMVAIPLAGAIGTVLKAQDAPKEEKGKWMFRHKSLGLLTGLVVCKNARRCFF